MPEQTLEELTPEELGSRAEEAADAIEDETVVANNWETIKLADAVEVLDWWWVLKSEALKTENWEYLDPDWDEQDDYFEEDWEYIKKEDGYYVEWDDEYISQRKYDNYDYRTCDDCWNVYPNSDHSIHTHDTDVYVCEWCFDRWDGRCCDDCWDAYADPDRLYWADDWLYCEDCIWEHEHNDFDDDTSSQSWYIEKTMEDFNKNLFKLKVESPLPRKVFNYIENFYDEYYNVDEWNKFMDIDKSFEVSVSKEWKAADHYSTIQHELASITCEQWVISKDSIIILQDTYKYKKKKLVWSKWHQVELKYIDSLWSERIWKESIISISEYTLKHIKRFITDNYRFTHIQDKISCEWKNFNWDVFQMRRCNDVTFKTELAEMNEDFRSCQVASNRKWYARGQWDFICAWTIVPVEIRLWWKIVWRMVTRIMYDEEWSMYVMLDRLYWVWQCTSNAREIYIGIAKAIYNMWYDLVVPNHSQHDTSVEDKLWNFYEELEWYHKNIFPESSVRSPNRRYRDIPYGYYNDSYSKAMRSTQTNGLFYDYLNKKNFYTLTHEPNGISKKTITFNESTSEFEESWVSANRVQPKQEPVVNEPITNSDWNKIEPTVITDSTSMNWLQPNIAIIDEANWLWQNISARTGFESSPHEYNPAQDGEALSTRQQAAFPEIQQRIQEGVVQAYNEDVVQSWLNRQTAERSHPWDVCFQAEYQAVFPEDQGNAWWIAELIWEDVRIDYSQVWGIPISWELT